MNKIVILHCPNTFNYGSAMMGINFVYYLSSIFNKETFFFFDLDTTEDLNRLILETLNKSTIKKFNSLVSLSGLNTFEKFSRIIRLLIYPNKKFLSFNPIGIVVLGGDTISEYGTMRGLLYNLYQFYAASKKNTVFLLGHTIGPFYSWRKKLVPFCLRNCHIITRDQLSALYLKNDLNLKNVLESSDLAFLDLPRQHEIDSEKTLFEKYGITSNEYITLIPSGLVNHYTSSKTDYIQTWIKVITQLSKYPTLQSKKIVLLAHVLRPDNADDRNIINQIKDELPDEYSSRIIYITDVLLPSEARIILGNGVFTITGRMHGAISTFQMVKPAISLSYSVKYKGVIGKNLGMPDLIIEANSDILWSSGEIVELIMNKVDYVLLNYNEIISRIDIGVKKNKKMAITQIDYIVEKLEALIK